VKALLQENRKGGLEVADVPAPRLGPGGVLVRTAYSLISAGTERSTRELARKSLMGKALARPDQVRKVLEVAQREGITAARQRVASRLDVRRPLGYSSAGLVVDVGASAGDRFWGGQRIACAGGGYANHADLVYVPTNLCVPVPEGVDLESAAFTAVGAVALQGVRQADVRLGERVAVIGLGLVGQLAAQLLRAAGCSVIGVDVNGERCRLAMQLGAERCLVPDRHTIRQVRSMAPEGVDAVLLTAATTSSDPLELAADICRDRARVVAIGAVGMHVPREPFYAKELDLRLSRSYGPGRYDSTYEERGQDYPIGYVRWTENRNMQAFLDLLARGVVNVAPLISHRFPLDRADAAYDLVEGRIGEPFLGVLFTYPHEPSPPLLSGSRVALQSPTKPPLSAVERGIGLIGAGNFASGTLLPALRIELRGRRSQLRGIASASGISARTVGRRFGFAFCTADANQIFADEQTRGVIIATRHNEHASLVIAALEAGKAVFVEKPLALTRDELAHVVIAQRAARQPVLVGFNRRFSPLAEAVRVHFADRAEPLMVLVRVNAGFLPREHWTQDYVEGGGRILGEGCHFVDLMQFLVGAWPTEVAARCLPDAGRYSGDNICATLRFADGSLGTLLYVANGDPALPKERIEVLGAGRSAVLDDFREALLYAGGRSQRIRIRGQDKGHRAEVAAFVDMLHGGGPPPGIFDEAVVATLGAIAIRESAAGGHAVSIEPDAIHA
jgi:predicted dehydrogenase/threonine dehydrogenase-like Zn-dependent dehydrogenase